METNLSANDDETDSNTLHTDVESAVENNDSNEEVTNNTSTRKKHNIIDSDDSDDEHVNTSLGNQLESVKDKDDEADISFGRKSHRIVYSDSDEDNVETTLAINSDSNDSNTVQPKLVESGAGKNDETSSSLPENPAGNINENQKGVYARLKQLYDSESSEEEIIKETEPSEFSQVTKGKKQPTKSKRKAKDVNKPMTAKQAQKERQEIYSESQRRFRESSVSLPYHMTKNRSIKEFLQQRPRLSLTLSNTVTTTHPALSIKLFTQQKDMITKQLHERKKEVEKFYKSESESEEEPNADAEAETETETNEIGNVEENNEETPEINCEEQPESSEATQDTQLPEEQNDLEQEASVCQIAETPIEEANTSNEKNKSIEYDFNFEESENPMEETKQTETEPEQRLKVADLIKAQFGNITPKLSLQPDEEIDLDDGIVKPTGIAKLVERFMQHSKKQVHTKDKVELNVSNFTQGELHNEILSIPVDPEEEIIAIEKPGVKLNKWKSELKSEMAQKRSEFWRQKAVDVKPEDEKQITNDETPDLDKILDYDEEEEFTDIDEEEDEDYEEYLKKTEKNEIQSEFIEDEADESDLDDDDDTQVEEKSENENNQDVCDGKKPLRRILKRFTEDSDDDEEIDQNESLPKPPSHLTQTWEEEDVFPPNRPVLSTPLKEGNESKSEFGFLTPIMQLTALQNLNSASKFSEQSPVTPLTDPLNTSNLKQSLQKKLFSDDSETNFEENAEQSLEKFDMANTSNVVETVHQLPVSTQDLLSVVSGKFTSSDGITLTTQTNETQQREHSNLTIVQLGDNSEIKNFHDDNLISQLLDEDELERFKKKFNSPIVISEVQGGGRILDSDEEDADMKMSKKPQRRIVFSDDEDEEEEEAGEDEEEEEEGENSDVNEEIDLHDNLDEEDELNAELEYNSEEELIPQQKGLKLAEFVENEAELTESEWGSEDEDEKDLDKLEVEQGDGEVFDEDELRSDLGKIHMRRVLDEDKHEVKLLQELLLEDGELHGTGRQRQFRWKNIDSLDDNNDENKGDVDTFLDDEDCEEKWRIMRYERENFLKNSQNTQNIDNDDLLSNDSNSQLIKLGQEVMKKVSIIESLERTKVITPTTSSKQPFDLMNKRGSFLTRNEQVLTKLAEITKSTAEPIVGGVTKSSKSFLFQSVEVSTKITALPNSKKRKGEVSTPNVLKKLRLSSNMSPLATKKSSNKKLF